MIRLIFSLAIVIFTSLTLSAQSDTIVINKDLQLIHLQDSVFIHLSWVNSEQYGRFSCNGMLVVRKGEAIIVDTPMTNEQTKEMIDYLNDVMGVRIKALIAGHFHADCMGGLLHLQSVGAESIACHLTVEKCKEEGLPVPSISFESEYDFAFHGLPIECRFYGGGHSFDNITVRLPNQQILFGGCMVKSARSQNLGNLSDARVDEWDKTIEKIQYAYPNIKTVVTGHGDIGGAELLNHTIELVREKQHNP